MEKIRTLDDILGDVKSLMLRAKVAKELAKESESQNDELVFKMFAVQAELEAVNLALATKDEWKGKLG